MVLGVDRGWDTGDALRAFGANVRDTTCDAIRGALLPLIRELHDACLDCPPDGPLDVPYFHLMFGGTAPASVAEAGRNDVLRGPGLPAGRGRPSQPLAEGVLRHPDAELVLTGDHSAVQAFTVGGHVLARQIHPELTVDDVDRLVDHNAGLLDDSGLRPGDVRGRVRQRADDWSTAPVQDLIVTPVCRFLATGEGPGLRTSLRGWARSGGSRGPRHPARRRRL